jgi:hypothetical protein
MVVRASSLHLGCSAALAFPKAYDFPQHSYLSSLANTICVYKTDINCAFIGRDTSFFTDMDAFKSLK